MVNAYLAGAYGLLWAIFVVYALTLHRRQKRLENELRELSSGESGRDTPGAHRPR